MVLAGQLGCSGAGVCPWPLGGPCVFSRTLTSALCANVELKSPLHCAGSSPREKAIESVSFKWIGADSKGELGRGWKTGSPPLPPT